MACACKSSAATSQRPEFNGKRGRRSRRHRSGVVAAVASSNLYLVAESVVTFNLFGLLHPYYY